MPNDAGSARQVVVLLVDGICVDVLRGLLEQGHLPSMARLFDAIGGGSQVGAAAQVRTLCSVFPSTTGPAHLPFVTGRYPGPCNLPGIRWLDPARYAGSPLSLSRFRSYMGPGALLLAHDVHPGVRTIFDVVPDHACAGGNFRRGVQRSRNLTRWSKLREPVISFFTEQWDRLDREAGRAVAGAVRRGTELVFGVFYAADSLGHKHGPFHETTRTAYRRIDAALADLADNVCRQPAERRPFVLLVSDHGQSETQRHLDLHGLVERVVGSTLAHPTIWRGLFGAAAAVMVSGNAMAHVYLRGRRWGERLALDNPSAEAARLIEALLAEDAVDQVIGRGSTGGAIVLSRDGRARIEPSPGGIRYQVTAGIDPFLYPASFSGTRSTHEWLDLTWESRYPDAPVQVLQILESARVGHLVVTAKPGWDLRARYEKPRHAGSHGSLHRDHMMTPLLASGPLRPGPGRTVDVFPTVLQVMGLDVPPGLDGESLWTG